MRIGLIWLQRTPYEARKARNYNLEIPVKIFNNLLGGVANVLYPHIMQQFSKASAERVYTIVNNVWLVQCTMRNILINISMNACLILLQKGNTTKREEIDAPVIRKIQVIFRSNNRCFVYQPTDLRLLLPTPQTPMKKTEKNITISNIRTAI